MFFVVFKVFVHCLKEVCVFVGEKEVFFLTFMFVVVLDFICHLQAGGSMEMSFLAFFDVIIVLTVAESCGRVF